MHTIGEKQSVAAAIKALGNTASLVAIYQWLKQHEGELIEGNPMGLHIESMGLDLIRLNRDDLLPKLHKYLFKLGKRGEFEKEVDFEAANITVIDRGWFNSSDLPEYETYLVLQGVDELEGEWKQIFKDALEVFEVKQLS